MWMPKWKQSCCSTGVGLAFLLAGGSALAQGVPPLLTLDDAIAIALKDNRLVKNSLLEEEKYDFRISSVRSRRLPEFRIMALETELIRPVDVSFKEGAFGIFPGIGPVPGIDTTIRTPARLNTFGLASALQPLTQQYKIGLGIRAQKLGRETAREELRSQRQKTANEVRKTYYGLMETQAALVAAREAVKTLREVERVTGEYAAEAAVLKSDVLEVRSRLARQEYELAVAENGLATQSEHLNQLLGRELTANFRVSDSPEAETNELTLEAARQHAKENRPELRQMRLKLQLADYDRRIEKAGYIPDVSLAVGYMGIRSIEAVPNNVAAAGLFLSWEPFDWGRRKDALEEKSRSVAQARNGVSETESQIAVEVALHYRKRIEAQLLLKAAQMTQETEEERLRVAKNKFQEQAVLVKDVLQAEAQREESVYQHQRALAAYWRADAELKKAMGEE